MDMGVRGYTLALEIDEALSLDYGRLGNERELFTTAGSGKSLAYLLMGTARNC